MWKHCENSVNSVQDSRCYEAYIGLCQDHIDFNTDVTVDGGEMTSIINDLSYNNSPGLDGLTAEHIHMKYADPQRLVLLSALVTSILVHGYIPKLITKYVIVTVIKNKSRRLNEKSNYRRICISSIRSKIVWMFPFKELLRFYTKHGSGMYAAFLDASKAFDRVNRHQFIKKLATRDVPKCLLKVICNEYTNQSVCVRWDLLTRNSTP